MADGHGRQQTGAAQITRTRAEADVQAERPANARCWKQLVTPMVDIAINDFSLFCHCALYPMDEYSACWALGTLLPRVLASACEQRRQRY